MSQESKARQDNLRRQAHAAEDRADLPDDIQRLLRNTGSEILMLRAERDDLKQRLNLAEDMLREFVKPTRPTVTLGRSFI